MVTLNACDHLLLFCVQDEEEVPPESGKGGKDEDEKEEAQKDETAKEKQDESEKSADEEKSQEKTQDAGSKTDAKVRSVARNLSEKHFDVEAKHVACLWRLASTGSVLIVTILLLVKEEKDGEKSGNTEAEKDVEIKAKPQKKSKISEDITVTLITKDILDPTEDDVTSSKKK